MAQMNVLGGLVFALRLLVPLTSAKTIDVNYCTKTPTSAWILLQQPIRLQYPNFQQPPVQPESVAATHTAKEHPAKSLLSTGLAGTGIGQKGGTPLHEC